jgi:hypothetical protein
MTPESRDQVTAAEHRAARTQTLRVWAELQQRLRYQPPTHLAQSRESG